MQDGMASRRTESISTKVTDVEYDAPIAQTSRNRRR